MPPEKRPITIWILGSQVFEQDHTGEKGEAHLINLQNPGQPILNNRHPDTGVDSTGNEPSQLNLGGALKKLSEIT